MDDYNHYMTKAAITRGIVEGTPGKTLCGEVFVPNGQGDGEVMSADLPVCPLCEVIHDAMARKKYQLKPKNRAVHE